MNNTISIIKNTDCRISFRCYNNNIDKVPTDLTLFKNIIFVVTDNKSVIIRKSLATNDIDLYSLIVDYPSIIRVYLKKKDTINLFTNPSDEEIIRYYEIVGITLDGSTQQIEKGFFYLEENNVY